MSQVIQKNIQEIQVKIAGFLEVEFREKHSLQRRQMEGNLGLENRWKVFYVQKDCGGYSMSRRSCKSREDPVKILGLQVLWKPFYVQKTYLPLCLEDLYKV